MTPSLGPKLKALRTAAGLTQRTVADRLGVSRPTLTQWEADTYRPSPENLRKLDQLYGAQGELIKLAQGARPAEGGEPSRSLYLVDVYRDVVEALVKKLVVDDNRRPLGWGRNVTAESPGPLGTAYVVRTLQLLDSARVDLSSTADFLERSRVENGWSYRSLPGRARPEVTAVVLAALARMGRLVDVDEALDQLEASLDPFALDRPYILSIVLEAVVAMRPESDLAHRLTRALLDSRTRYADRTLWTMNASASADRTTPSLAHTARATAVLRLARPSPPLSSEVDDAVELAVEWMISLHKGDTGVIELLEGSETRPSVAIHHFTAACVVRALAGAKGAPATRVQAALDILWESYSPTDGLWTWLDEGSLPSWMTHDAVSALRAVTEASMLLPLTGGNTS